ncbi:MAG TPA: ribosome biogenesis GTP-binding protein YihA/YsxC [Acidobacteriaceae bacterium]|jgi:GTP-binding protein
MRLTSKFLLSATSAKQFPSASAPEFAFLGRSNVGKSSLINGLLGEKAAKVSATPGRTRAINFFSLLDSPSSQQPRLLFADLPGYGYAKISKSISAEWPAFINPYLEGRSNLALCVCLVDSNIPEQPSDRQLIDALKSMGRDFLVVGTKADRLSGNERTKAILRLKQGLELDDLLLCSAKTGFGMKELWTRILAVNEPASVRNA